MKTTLKIARTELASMFYSPIAWLLLAIFTVQGFMAMEGRLEWILRIKMMGYPSLVSLTGFIFSGKSGSTLTEHMQSSLYLYIPLLTMGIIARERFSGSITLLLSSPVKISQIILGKYFAIITYCALLMLILVIYLLLAGYTIENTEYLLGLSGIFGLYLLICTYAAIGLFMSCLTVHQVVAAISTLTVLAALQFVDNIWQGIPLMGDISYWLSLSGRTKKFLVGLITTKDVLYFVIITCMFLYFCILKLSSGRKHESKNRTIGKYVLTMAAAFFIGNLVSFPAFVGYLDVTRGEVNSLSKESLAIIEPIKDKKWKLTSYANILDPGAWGYGSPDSRNSEFTRFENYTRYMPNLEMEVVQYYDKAATEKRIYNKYPGKSDEQIARIIAKQMNLDFEHILSPKEIKEIVDLEDEGYRFVQHLEVDGKKEFLRVFDDSVYIPLETEISAAFKRLVQGAVKIAFVNNHRERSIVKKDLKGYQRWTSQKLNRRSLANQGYDVVELDIAQTVSPEVNILVIADPKKPFSQIEQKNLKEYIARGGDLLIAGDAKTQAIVNPLIKELGVELMEGQLLQKTKDYSGNLIQTLYQSKAATIGFDVVINRTVSAFKAVGINYDSHKSDFMITPLLTISGQNVWNRQGLVDLDSNELVFNPQTDLRGDYTVALALTRDISGRQQRILILGDGDILSTSEWGRGEPAVINYQFGPAAYGWLSHGAYPVNIQFPKPTDLMLTINDGDMIWLKIIFYGIFPGAILLFGFSLLYRRKRR